MKLPFRYQFVLTPLVIVTFLACLVYYTLVELGNIRTENELTVKRELLTDRIQTVIANATLLDRMLEELKSSVSEPTEEYPFHYVEQAIILADSLVDADLVEELSMELRRKTERMALQLREPEQLDPNRLHDSLLSLLPPLQYQHKIFLAKRRSAFIDYHRNLSVIVPRLSGVLLTVLGICMVLGLGLAILGLRSMRRRLRYLAQRARELCGSYGPALPAPTSDELVDLEYCLDNMAQRFSGVVTLENVLQAAENERRRIAMDMHDGVLADMTAIVRKLDVMGSLEARDVSELRAGVDDIITGIRCIIDDLHPQTLEILGLEAALRSFVSRHCEAPEFPLCHFEFDPIIEDKLKMFEKINLFRIVTEAINNLTRHAHSKRFEISMRLLAQRLVITVEDNGLGMPASGLIEAGQGCSNIRERARTIGATVQWCSSRFSSGTRVELILPLDVSG